MVGKLILITNAASFDLKESLAPYLGGWEIALAANAPGGLQELSYNSRNVVCVDYLGLMSDLPFTLKFLQRNLAGLRVPVVLMNLDSPHLDVDEMVNAGVTDYVPLASSPRDIAFRCKLRLNLDARPVDSDLELKTSIFTLRPETSSLIIHSNGTDATVELSIMQFKILYHLVNLKGRAITRLDLAKQLWPHKEVREGTINVHICELRKKLGEVGKLISTDQRGVLRFLYNHDEAGLMRFAE
ncbi:MAG: response regulator transcription factor [Proteobacteria bacterium]|nr:MAG: response regulator transcription factor [Pseudomonadota bacterium]